MDELRKLAERIVEARKDDYDACAYDYCPCCGYDGMWSAGTREDAVDGVLSMLRAGSVTAKVDGELRTFIDPPPTYAPISFGTDRD